MPAPAIEADNLSKRYGQIQALDGVSFTIPEGEIFGYLGPNGAGKTTTIRILTGITQPTGGTARIFGHDIIAETIESRRHMGIVHETSNVYDDLTAWQNLIFTAELYHVPKAGRDGWAKELLETFDLLGRKDDLAHGFSKGMKRRLTLAMGLMNHPRLLFLDEPTSGLDVQSNLIIRRVIRRLADEGVTVFLTTHNIEEANLTCDRVAIIDHGRIAAVDSPERLKKTIQSVQSVEVGLDRLPDELRNGRCPFPSVNAMRREGDKVRFFTDDPSVVIPAVIAYADREHLKVLSLTTYGPSLEDVFIRLTGLDAAGREEGRGLSCS